jgi:histidine triad (HIT) family protein
MASSHAPDPGCVFCMIVEGRAPAYRVFEDAATVAFLDLFPFTRGHLLVVHRRHAPRLTDYAPEEQAALVRAVATMCSRVERLAPDYNLAMNAGAAAGQIVFHVHFHIIPRYGEPNPFHPSQRQRIRDDDAKKIVAELARP